MTMIDLRPLQIWKTRDILTCHIRIFLKMSYCTMAVFSPISVKSKIVNWILDLILLW